MQNKDIQCVVSTLEEGTRVPECASAHRVVCMTAFIQSAKHHLRMYLRYIQCWITIRPQ